MAYVPVEDAGAYNSTITCCSYYSLFLAEAEFDKVVFLYHLEHGQAAASYGLNVASLAGLPSSILRVAHSKSKQLEEDVLKKTSTQSQLHCDLSNTALELHSLLSFLNQSHVSLPQALRSRVFLP